MARKSTIRLLLINKSDNEGERLISLFRNAGRVARAHRASTLEALHNSLNDQDWDLVIADDNHPEISVEQCLEQLQKTSPHIPAIVLRDSDTQSALDAGASDVVASEDDQRLIFAAFRELEHAETFQELALLKIKLAETEQRCNLLMDQSQDAIAYLADGMLVSTNPLFCQRFGYESTEELDCVPMIDLIEPADQDTFKNLLKAQLNSSAGESSDFQFTGLKHNDETFKATMQLTNAIYDDEACIQLTVRESGGDSGTTVNLNLDPATGLYSHDYFLAQLQSRIKQAEMGTSISTLFFIGIDKFNDFRSQYGITHAYNILLDIARFIQQNSEESSCLAHFCDDGFTMLLTDTDSDAALEYAKLLCSKLEQHIIEVNNHSIQCTASIGLLTLDSQTSKEPSILIDNAYSTCESVRDRAGNNGIGNSAAIYIPERQKQSLGDARGDEELDQILEDALEDNQFQLVFQPVVSLRGTSGDHYEVQVSMLNDDGEQAHADEFLQSLQFDSVNTRLDRWIILEATKQLATKIEQGQDIRLFINLTANALQDETLLPWLGVALKASDIPPSALALQFIETDISRYLKPAKTFADSIHELGCKLSIAGFGQSDDPIKTLKHVNANFAKIADSYTEELQSNGDNQNLKTMVNSINENQTQAIISGVENAAALAVLWQLGVDYIQGTYLSGPSEQMNYEFTDIA